MFDQLVVMMLHPAFRGQPSGVPIRVFGGDLPTRMQCIKCYKDGKALLGGRNGNIYQLKMDLAGAFIEEGFNASIVNLTWEFKHLLARPTPVYKILIDLERDLAYALHESCEVEVLSIEETIISDKPCRVAHYEPPPDVRLISFAVLPLTGFRDAVLLGVTPDGGLYYFGLDRRILSPQDVAKRAKTWCGIGLKHNLKVTHMNAELVRHFEEEYHDGGVISVLSVMQTTIYLGIYGTGSGMSTIWELKNGCREVQELQLVKNISVQGKIEGLQMMEPLELRPTRARPIEKRFQSDELTMQHFYYPAKMIVFSKEQYQTVERLWPSDILKSILLTDNIIDLNKFIRLYGAGETAAMAISLWFKGVEAAKMILLKHEALSGAVDQGFCKLFKRWMSPVWMMDVFENDNTGSFLRPNNIIRARQPPKVLEVSFFNPFTYVKVNPVSRFGRSLLKTRLNISQIS